MIPMTRTASHPTTARHGARAAALLVISGFALTGCAALNLAYALPELAAVVPTVSTSAVPTPTVPVPPATPDLGAIDLPGVALAAARQQQPAAIGSFVEAKAAVVQVVSGAGDGALYGSGFVISPDGLVVTSDHVVAGATEVTVHISGENATDLPATVIGVSECDDLALLDIEGSENFPYLEWFADDVYAGMDVYSAGYPLGDPEYTLSRGVVTKVNADGTSSWSDIDHVIEHDAAMNSGSSGGPLLDANGKVVGVNYSHTDAGVDGRSVASFYAIAVDTAQPVVNRLLFGNFNSLGITGDAGLTDGKPSIVVASVQPGSPAAKLGLLVGDAIMSMNGKQVGADGIFQRYCDVVRRNSAADLISLNVVRPGTNQRLYGVANSTTPLTVVGLLDESSAASEQQFVEVRDDSGAIKMRIPEDWDRRTTPMDNGQPRIGAAPADSHGAQFLEFYRMETAGAATTQDVEAELARLSQNVKDWESESTCDFGEVQDYFDGLYEGNMQVITCTDPDGFEFAVVLVVAQPKDGQYLLVLDARLEDSTAGLQVFTEARDSFKAID